MLLRVSASSAGSPMDLSGKSLLVIGESLVGLAQEVVNPAEIELDRSLLVPNAATLKEGEVLLIADEGLSNDPTRPSRLQRLPLDSSSSKGMTEACHRFRACSRGPLA